MHDDSAARLLDEAANAGLRITGLDGWNQTRLAGSLKIRREVINAIINRGPTAEPSGARPKMIEACRKIIAFAAVISRKDDLVVQREVEAVSTLDDDQQAYECHKLRLRRLVEDAVGGGAFIEGMYRVGELSSQAAHAPRRFRVKMIGNVVTAIQRLLDKPASRSIPVQALSHNLRRLTKLEWAARGAARAITEKDERAGAADDLGYIRGQVGYAMIFNGLLAGAGRAVARGRRRLWRAVRRQPGTENGHWSNLLRAINDLMGSGHAPAAGWARPVVRVAELQKNTGFALAFNRLREKGELATLVAFWEQEELMGRVSAVLNRAEGSGSQAQAQAPVARPKRVKGTTAAAILTLVGLFTFASSARAGDGKELARRGDSGQRVAMPTAPAPMPGRPGGVGGGGGMVRMPTFAGGPGAGGPSAAMPDRGPRGGARVDVIPPRQDSGFAARSPRTRMDRLDRFDRSDRSDDAYPRRAALDALDSSPDVDGDALAEAFDTAESILREQVHGRQQGRPNPHTPLLTGIARARAARAQATRARVRDVDVEADAEAETGAQTRVAGARQARQPERPIRVPVRIGAETETVREKARPNYTAAKAWDKAPMWE